MGSTYNHYSVRWNSHHSHLTTMLTTLMRTETLCDITLVCDDGTVKAHQNILSACSPFFSRLFEANQQPHPLIYMRDMKVQEMRTLLDFMYEGEVIVDKHNMPSFFKAAMDLQLQVLEHIETAAAEQDLQCERDTLTASTSTNSESEIFRSNNCSQLELLHDNDQPKKQPSPAGPDTTVQQIFDNTDNDLPTEINCTPDCGRLTTEDRSANTVKNKKKRKLTTTCTNSAESAFAPLNERQAVHDVKPSPHTNSDENTNPNNELQVSSQVPEKPVSGIKKRQPLKKSVKFMFTMAKESKLWCCKLCGEQVQFRQKHLNTHKLRHHFCPFCPSSFKRIDYYQRHIWKVHSGQKMPSKPGISVD